jgi:beta-glucosidase
MKTPDIKSTKAPASNSKNRRDLTLEEKASLTTGANFWSTQAATPIGLPAIRVADGPHGLRVQDDENPDHLGLGRSLPSTCFPPAVTLASSWDLQLIREVGAALGREARSLGVQVVLGPGLNIKRTPLCGRNFEYFSEDPLLSGLCAAAQVEGLQSQGVAACAKHFAANNQEFDRYRISADIDERPLWEIYLRSFKVMIDQAPPWMMMTSYNRINGTYSDESQWLVTDTLKGAWKYDGVVVSDWGAIYDPVAAVQAGVDLRMPGRPEDDRVCDAVRSGAIQESRLDDVVARLLRLNERVSQPATAPIDVDKHHQLTRCAAAASAVLLKNERKALPIELANVDRIAIIGELAQKPRYQGAGSSAVNPTRITGAFDALSARLSGAVDLRFAPGYDLASIDGRADLIAEAVRVAAACEVVVLFLGLPTSAEAEGRDRAHIDLPRNQLDLIEAVSQVSTRLVVALSNGSVVTTAPWRKHAAAIVEFWLTGQAHGDAVADILLGDVNPSGKLAETIPRRLQDTPAFLAYPGECGHARYGEGIYVGYRYYDARELDVDFAFGHGLSYTEFAYADLEVTCHPAADDTALTVALTVTNVGERAGAEVVQVYVDDQAGRVVTPRQELRAFSKVLLSPGQSKRISIPIPRQRLEHYVPSVGWAYNGGPADIRVGSSSRDIRLRHTVELPRTPLDIKLTVWSTLEEWYAHPDLGPRLTRLVEQRGGVRGRAGDLLADPVGRKSILAIPLQGLMQFPGFPVNQHDVDQLLKA